MQQPMSRDGEMPVHDITACPVAGQGGCIPMHRRCEHLFQLVAHQRHASAPCLWTTTGYGAQETTVWRPVGPRAHNIGSGSSSSVNKLSPARYPWAKHKAWLAGVGTHTESKWLRRRPRGARLQRQGLHLQLNLPCRHTQTEPPPCYGAGHSRVGDATELVVGHRGASKPTKAWPPRSDTKLVQHSALRKLLTPSRRARKDSHCLS